ncbi:MAG: hypothetical protein RL069_543, partial [Planctomycetota bacterium]
IALVSGGEGGPGAPPYRFEEAQGELRCLL